MAETKGSKAGAATRKSGMNVDVKLVRELAEMLEETGLVEIEVEDGERKIRVSRGGGVAVAAPAAMAAPAPSAPTQAPAPTAETSASDGDTGNALKSPMVGTAYLSPDPEAPPFKAVGDAVKKGDTLLIVEAMKVMNPITADRDGTLEKVFVENAQPVEYDQPLLVIG